MIDRIKQIRKDNKVTQKEFAEAIGVKHNTVAQFECGKMNFSDRTIREICRIYNVNEDWIRTGEGEPYIKLTRNQELATFFNDAMGEGDGSPRKEFLYLLSKMETSDWENLLAIMKKWSDSTKKEEE